jgi:hypothetical protein
MVAKLVYLTNYNILKVKSLPWTNTKPSRISITSERFKQRIEVPYPDEDLPGFSASFLGALIALKDRGFNIIGQAEGQGCTYIISDTFKPLKGK